MTHLSQEAIGAAEPTHSSPENDRCVLVAGNVALIDSVVGRISSERGGGVDLDEARLDAAEGLVDAARLYDSSRGVPFESYAPTRVRGAVVDGERRLHKLAGPGRRQARVVSLFNNTNARSMDAPLSPYTTATLHDVVVDDGPSTEEIAAANFDVDAFYGVLAPLTDRQRAVVALKARGHTLDEIGAQLDVSKRTVSRDYRAAVGFILQNVDPTLF